MTKAESDYESGIRLQKVLAGAGVGSRRACEELIDAGRVEVDGEIVREQGMRVDPDAAIIKVDGSRISTKTDAVYLVLNKPRGVVSTMNDPEGRPCVGDYVQDRAERLFHVGRLDTDTEGLILLTNDGELANRLMHPKYGVPKTYLADIAAPVPRDLGRRLKIGFELEDGHAAADKFRLIGAANGRAQVEMVIHEGRTHIVRRLMEAAGHPVIRLIRTHIGPVTTGNLTAGRLRHLTSVEVSQLLGATEASEPAAKKAAAKRTASKTAAANKPPAKRPRTKPSEQAEAKPAAKARFARNAPTKKAAAQAPGRGGANPRAAKVNDRERSAGAPSSRSAAPRKGGERTGTGRSGAPAKAPGRRPAKGS
ncbi:MAG: pseudouridine synthase [Sporichthyaceae bacterium]